MSGAGRRAAAAGRCDPMTRRPRTLRAWAFALGLGLAAALPAAADAVDALKAFTETARSGRASFTQTVTSPDGARKRTSSGRFEFARPNRFRFEYLKPYPQTLVADGQKIWMHDPDLNQVTVRLLDQGLGATPAALLAGTDAARTFTLTAVPDRDGLQWVQAVPRTPDATLKSMQAGFRGGQLVAVELLDSFGQKSRLDFIDLAVNVATTDDTFRFVPPPGADVVGP